MKQQYNPAKEYLRSQRRREQEDMYLEWSSYLPYGWCEVFCKDGLIPFLKQHGYVLGCGNEQLREFVDEWAFAHVQLTSSGSIPKYRYFTDCYHSGGRDEYDWFVFKLSTSDWFTFADTWSTDGFLDDSDAGHSQRMDLAIFIWNLIDLDMSKSHNEWLQYTNSMNYQDELYGTVHSNTEDMHSYGGERRSY